MFAKEVTLPDSLFNTLEMFLCHMYDWKKTMLVMLATVCIARVVEKSPVMHSPL